MSEYINKPVPVEAINTGQSFGYSRIFILKEFIRLLVNDKGIVTFEYANKPLSSEEIKK